jgi:hypothetical protein
LNVRRVGTSRAAFFFSKAGKEATDNVFEHIVLHLALREAAKKKAVRSGALLKHVPCENCGTEYVYVLRDTIMARAQASQEEVDRRAEATLRKKLEEGCEPVPCPACGWYQAHMVAHARRNCYSENNSSNRGYGGFAVFPNAGAGAGGVAR